MSDLWTLLRARARECGGAPLVTYVDAPSGARTELSATSMENAAAKIANALRDAFELEPGDSAGLFLPVHWQRAAWCAGAWTAGIVVAPLAADADLIVAGPSEATALDASRDIAVVSLHPFGLPITDALPAHAEDVTLVVRQQPDAYLFDPPGVSDVALRMPGDVGDIDQAELLGRAQARGAEWGLEPGGRLLVDESLDGMDAWLAVVAVPLACRASVVLVNGDASTVASQERVTAVATGR